MRLVPVQLAPSAIHGIGVHAAQPIARGTVVWRFTPGFDLECDPAEVQAQPPLLRERLLHYGYVDRRLRKYVLCGDDARFLNHAPQPSLAHEQGGGPHGRDVAARDIAAGEELTVDCRVFEGGEP